MRETKKGKKEGEFGKFGEELKREKKGEIDKEEREIRRLAKTG